MLVFRKNVTTLELRVPADADDVDDAWTGVRPLSTC
jgi:glycerol-3-phosphate dehydrogenase